MSIPVVTGEKRPGPQPQHETPVDGEPGGAAVNVGYTWSRRRQSPPGAGDRWGARAAVTFCWRLRGDASAGGYRGTPRALAALLAAREDMDTTLGDQRLPYKPPDMPHCYVSDLKIPRSYKVDMRSEHAHLWKDSARREFHGLPDARTFELV